MEIWVLGDWFLGSMAEHKPCNEIKMSNHPVIRLPSTNIPFFQYSIIP